MDEQSVTAWWGAFELDEGQGGHWQVGPCSLWLYRTAHEWRVLSQSGDDPLAAGSRVAVPAADEAVREALQAAGEDWTVSRYSFRQTDPGIVLRPALADRPVIVRPENPLFIPAGEEVTLYVSTPLWVQIERADAAKLLHEQPAYRPSDTWFGPSTREGELCYASRTAGRFQLANLPLRRHRAVTPLVVRNHASEALNLERAQIPTPHLTLYESAEHDLWTQAVTLDRREGAEGATVDIKHRAPREVQVVTRIHEPRHEAKKGLVMSTFQALGALFSH